MQEQYLEHETQQWNPPLPLEGVTLLSWPQGAFPPLFENFIVELSRSTETPIELAAMLTLAAVATASQKRCQVQIKEDYSEPLNLWVLAILPPASRKSRVYTEITQPLREWEAERKRSIEATLLALLSRRKTMEARLKELRTKAAKAEELKLEILQEQIERLERELPELPTFPQLWTGDVTPEHLGTIMSQNDEAMAVLSDEGGIFDILAGLYSDGKANIDLFLQGHAGTAVRVDRGSRPPVFLNRPVLTMGLTVQPQVIKDVCGNKMFRGRGLVARCLFVIPPSNIGFRTLEEPPMSDDTRRQYGGCLKAILEHPDASPNGSSLQYHKICLEPAAFSKWKEYAKYIEGAMGPDIAHLDHISDWAGKLPGAIARIAGLLHLMRYCHDHPWLYPISLHDMTAAVKIGHVLTNHALMVFDLLNADKGLQLARDILKWITNEKIHHFTHRDCLRKFRRAKEAELKPALEILLDPEKDIIREREKLPETHKRRRTFDVNPHIFAK